MKTGTADYSLGRESNTSKLQPSETIKMDKKDVTIL